MKISKFKKRVLMSSMLSALASTAAANIKPEIQHEFKIGLEGHYQFLVSSESRGVKAYEVFPNLILDSGLNKLGGNTANPGIASYCRVGSGTTTPANTQSDLISPIALTNNASTTPRTDTYNAGGTPYTETVYTFRFATGVAAGTLAEVGIGWASSGSTLFSRALILDGSGNPTTLTILSDETLDVKYFLRIYSPTTDVTGSVVIGGTTYNYTLRAANIASTSYWSAGLLLDYGIFPNSFTMRGFPSTSTLGATTASPSGSATSASGTPTITSYVSGNFWKEAECLFALTDNPSGGIKCLFFSCGDNNTGAWFQLSFDTAIPKDNTKQFKFKVRVTWARV